MSNTQYAVCHLQKGSGNDSGMACHIERKNAKGERYVPSNADPRRTHLNRELVTFPPGVTCRTEAIQHRIDNANLHRKVGKNQVKAIRIILTGTHEQMMKLSDGGRLEEWISANLAWLGRTFGKENVVSCVLHMDEKTPHLHATVVPIVSSERKRREREGEKKYDTQAGNRLCCDEVMARSRLKVYQDTYAAAMKLFGLERGIVGSTATHKSKTDHLHDLIEQEAQLQADIERLQEEAEKANEGRSTVFSWFGKGDLANAKKSIADKDAQIARLQKQMEQYKSQILAVQKQKADELSKLRNGYEREIDAAIKRAEAAERKSAEKDKIIEQKRERIKELDRIANPHRYRLSSGATLEGVKFSHYRGMVASIMIWTKVGAEEHRATSNHIYQPEYVRYCKDELTDEELVNLCFEPQDQINEAQSRLLNAAILLAMGGTGQPHVGTGSGGSTDQSPWNGDDRKRRRR